MDKDNNKEGKGLIIVFTGNGKGKTTSALGIALRACGYDMKVCMIQFIKAGVYSGELNTAKRLAPNLEIIPFGKGFVGKGKNHVSHLEHKDAAKYALTTAKKMILDNMLDILILDEINIAVHLSLIDVKEVIELIKSKPYHLNLILTGRNAHRAIIDLSDLVTEMKEIKHPYKSGISAKRGIDF